MSVTTFLVGNGTHLYRRSGSLVRNPIRKSIVLAPTQRAWYAVAGSYVNGWPSTGFINASDHYTAAVYAGKAMRKAFLSPGTNQMWRAVTTAHDPEFVFYQGAATPSADSPGAESYLQLCGYFFEIPQKYADFGVEKVSMSIMHGGTILTRYLADLNRSAAYFAHDWPDSMGSALNSWLSGYPQRFGLFQNLVDPTTMYRAASDEITLDTAVSSGTPTEIRDLWGNYATSGDGYIPIASQTYVRSYDLSDTIALALNHARQGWITGIPEVSVSTAGDGTDTQNDYPIFDPSSNPACAGYWLCCSYWGLSLRVDLVL